MDLLQRYEKFCESSGSTTELAAFLSSHGGEITPQELLAVFKHDQRRQWLRGKRPSIEKYLLLTPRLSQADCLRELVANELQIRKLTGDAMDLADYLQRYPGLASDLQRLFSETDRCPSIATVPQELESLGEAFEEELAADASPDVRQCLGGRLPHTETAPADICFGDYRTVCQLGEGTFGIVYRAQHVDTGEQVAIKVLKHKWLAGSSVSVAVRGQFASEARAMLQFNHPHIVRVFAFNELAEPPFLVQQYVEGITLKERLQTSRPEIAESLQYAIEIAEGLTHIHSFGLWHRDLKPANVLLDRGNRVYLADFGLALADAQRWESRGRIEGTWAYMAPEQVQGDTHLLNARCDIWALGVILYEMLTGKRPFEAGESQQLRLEILHRTPAAPRDFDQEIPADLNKLCMQCLAKRDADRPASAADVRDQLKAILQDYSRPKPGENRTAANTFSASLSSGTRSCTLTVVCVCMIFIVLLIAIKARWEDIQTYFNSHVASPVEEW